MTTPDSYLTLKQTGESLFKDRGSRFIGYALPVEDEEEIKTHLQKISALHASSRHVCFGWRTGRSGQRERSSDAGEPSGTAGKPILTQLKTRELTNALVVVVRYFGGTLLGTGGLIHAYREAAVMAIENAGITEKEFTCIITATIDYQHYPLLFETLNTFQATLLCETAGETDVEVNVRVAESKAGDLKLSLEKLNRKEAR